MSIPVRVTTARESAARDAAAVAAGVPSRALMQRAGAAAAAEIARAYPALLRTPIAVYAGPGNNGGDGWVVARALAAAGARVRVQPAGETRTDDARAERALAEPVVEIGDASGARLIVDALLGTGARGAPREEIARAIARIREARESGAVVVSLDVPSGLDADTGDAAHAVRADLTIAFGTLKRGLAIARDAAGRVLVLDIGLGAAGDDDGAPALVSARWVHERVPRFDADAHKGTRKKLAIVGGQVGMVGAPILAARAAMRSGVGMVRVVVARENVPIVQGIIPEALARPWPASDADVPDLILDWADAVLIGPGLGATPEGRALAERVLGAWRGPVVVDADALNVFAGEASALARLLDGRPALLTPHVAEFSRLHGAPVPDVEARRFEIGGELAQRVSAAVLLKGVPTVVTATEGARFVSAAGTPALATAGSGDLLAGIAATLLAQLGDAATAGACAAWVHGRAAELAGEGEALRGITLDAVEHALPHVWRELPPDARPPLLAELPAIGERAP